MNGQRLTDAQISRALRAYLPAQASSGLYGEITRQIEVTRQQRPWPWFLRSFAEVDPATRQRLVLVLAALLLALLLGVIGVVGAFLNRPIHDSSLDPPTDLVAFVRSAYDQM